MEKQYKFNNAIIEKMWRDRYQKNNESVNDNLKRVAKFVSDNDQCEKDIYNAMSQGYFFFGGRTMSNAGIGEDLTVNNCFVAPQIQDSMDDIFTKVKLGAITHQKGGGIGYDFSLLRPSGTPTNNDAMASGALSFMDVFNAQTATILQGNRRGANMGVMNIYDMDIEEFITAKSKDPNRLNHFNLSVMVDDDFMKAVQNNKDIYLHFPVYDEKSHIIKDSNKWSQSKKISANYLWDLIMTNAYNNGEPGVFFYDNANNDNNLQYIETICCSNPCFEYLSGTVYGENIDSSQYGGACNLGSLMLHNFVLNPFTNKAEIDHKSLNNTIKIAVRCLDNIIDVNHFPDDIYKNYQESFRTIGLGVTGLADMLVMMGLQYDSTKARQLVDELMNEIAKQTYRASIDLAKEKDSFPFLNVNEFIKSGYLTKHMKDDNEWKDIVDEIKKHGIRNGKMLAVAPCGTMSLVWGNNCSSGIEPIFSLDYERKIRIGGQSEEDEQIIHMTDYAYNLAKTLPQTINFNNFSTALEISVDDHIEMLGAITKHIDMSVSKTINVPTEYSFEDAKDIYVKCWKLGIKGCTIFRPNEIRQGILLANNDKKKKDKKDSPTTKSINELNRGDIICVNDDLLSCKRTITNGCGKFYLHTDFDEGTGEPMETFIDIGSGGGCERNLQFISRLISLLLRSGMPIEEIIDQAKSIKPCTAYVSRTNSKHDTSKGSSCPNAIGFALEELNEKIHDRYFIDELEETDGIKDSHNIPSGAECPKCKEKTLYDIGGCQTCTSCGWSKCD